MINGNLIINKTIKFALTTFPFVVKNSTIKFALFIQQNRNDNLKSVYYCIVLTMFLQNKINEHLNN